MESGSNRPPKSGPEKKNIIFSPKPTSAPRASGETAPKKPNIVVKISPSLKPEDMLSKELKMAAPLLPPRPMNTVGNAVKPKNIQVHRNPRTAVFEEEPPSERTPEPIREEAPAAAAAPVAVSTPAPPQPAPFADEYAYPSPREVTGTIADNLWSPGADDDDDFIDDSPAAIGLETPLIAEPSEDDDDERDGSPGIGVRLINLFLLLGMPFLALMSFESIGRGSLSGFFTWLSQNPIMFLINFGLVAGVFAFFALFRRSRTRALVSLLFVFLFGLLGFVNYYKVQYRLEPLLLSDALQIGNIPSVLREFPMELNWRGLALLAGGTLLLMILSCVFLRYRRPKIQITWPIVGFIAIGLLLPTCTFQNNFVSEETDLIAYSRKGGGLYNMIAMESMRSAKAYAGYTPEEAEETYRNVAALALPDQKNTPNIIFVLSESFTDQKHLGQYLNFEEQIMPFYDELMAECISGEVYVPKVAGGTSETEFEVLTGLVSTQSISPYSTNLPPLRSVASVLRERGYHATAYHWYSSVFYNRNKNLKQLGFDEFYNTDTTNTPFEKVGMYVSDAEHYRAALNKMKETPERDFIFCITMQNHFPYDQSDFAKLYGAKAPFTDQLPEDSQLIATNFTYLLQESDNALKELIDSLSTFREPTLLVFFSDHIPPLGESFYEKVGMPFRADAGHLVPYFIWSNQGTLEKQRVDLQAWQLGAFALAQAGVSSDPFMRYVNTIREVGYDQTDECYRILSHDALYGDQAYYKAANLQTVSEKWKIGGDMKLLKVDAEQLGGKIYIIPHLADKSQKFKLSVNGRIMDDWCIEPSTSPVNIQCVLTNSRGVLFNYSNPLSFSSTDDLLGRSGKPEKLTLPLHNENFTFRREGNLLQAITVRKFVTQASSLMMDSARVPWQHDYALSRGGQYFVLTGHSLETPKPVIITINQKDFEGYEESNAGLQKYMQDHRAELTLLGEHAVK